MWSAVSWYYAGGPVLTTDYKGLKFDIIGDAPDIQLYFQSTGDGDQTAGIPLSTFAPYVNSTSWTTVLINFSDLPANAGSLPVDSWDRVDFQAQGSGATVSIPRSSASNVSDALH